MVSLCPVSQRQSPQFLWSRDVRSRVFSCPFGMRDYVLDGTRHAKLCSDVASKGTAKSRIWGSETPEPIAANFILIYRHTALLFFQKFGSTIQGNPLKFFCSFFNKRLEFQCEISQTFGISMRNCTSIFSQLMRI